MPSLRLLALPQSGAATAPDKGAPLGGAVEQGETEGLQIILKALGFIVRYYYNPSVTSRHLSTAVSVGASKLTLRDCHRQSAPSSEGGKGS